eukprot:COSAG06_NODE_69823_length_195_cov_102.979167_1_plen_44_part_01
MCSSPSSIHGAAGKTEAAEVTKDKSKNYSSGLKRVNKLRKENQL